MGSSINEVVAQDIKNVRGSGMAELMEVFLSFRRMRKYLRVVVNWDFISENALKKRGADFEQELCVSYGISITPGGGETLSGDVLGHVLEKNIHCGGRKRNPPYDPGFLVVHMDQLARQMYREFLFLKIWLFFFCCWLSSYSVYIVGNLKPSPKNPRINICQHFTWCGGKKKLM